MREIKFRAWDKKTKTMCFVLSAFMNNSGRVYSVKCHNGGEYGERDVDFLVTDFELMQYTGLKDKNGVKIYEGDIVKFKRDGEYTKGVVEFKAGRYIVRDIEVDDDDFDELYDIYGLNEISLTFNSELEVVGNIHQNPELLKNDKC